MANLLRVISFNCQSLKSYLSAVQTPCNSNDIIRLQETWLRPDEVGILNTIHSDFMASGLSSMEEAMHNEHLVGRPYAGIKILWRKSIAPKPVLVDDDDRIMGLNVVNNNGVMLCL